MTYAGARTDTEKQMANALSFNLPQSRLHPALNSLDQELARRGESSQSKDGEGFRLNIANAIWGQKNFSFLPGFLDTLALNYGAGLRVLDFMSAPEPSRLTINQWISDQTEGKIKDIIPQGAIDNSTRLVLSNAIYFNAAWQFPFKEERTSHGTFHILNGQEVTVPMMKQTESFGYARGDNYRAIELPYDGRELSMVILLPDSGQFESFEDSLDSQQVTSIINKIRYNRVILSMPKFEFESSFGLKDTLSAMGMPLAFTEHADFSGITGKKDLYIGKVLHKAFVAVDEAGTEAAASTVVIMVPTSLPPEPVEVTLDRPFIFLIRDIQTGTVLFVGRMMNPTG